MGVDSWRHLLSELQALQDGVSNSIEDDPDESEESTLWTAGRIEASQYTLDKQRDLLEQALLLNTRRQDRLAVLRNRVWNKSHGIGRLPDDVLIVIFESVIVLDVDTMPEVFASVCHRWRDVTLSDIGAGLWTKVDINVDDETVPAHLVDRVCRFVERSRLNRLVLSLTGADVGNDEMAILEAVTRPSFHRVCQLTVNNFELFAPWFPLGDAWPSLRFLRVWGGQRHLVTDTTQTPVLASLCPSLCLFELILDSPLESSQILPILNNVSHFASITHLYVHASDDIGGVYSCLPAFEELRYLCWRLCKADADDEEGEPPTPANEMQLSPFPYRTSQSSSSEGAKSRMHYRPSMHLSSGRFTSAIMDMKRQALKMIRPSYILCAFLPSRSSRVTAQCGRRNAISTLFDHPELEEATWVVSETQGVADLLFHLSLRISRQPAHMCLNKLQWLNIVWRYPFSDDDHDFDVDIVRHLKNLTICRDALRQSKPMQFKVRLNCELVNTPDELGEFVANHPWIVSEDANCGPPSYGETQSS